MPYTHLTAFWGKARPAPGAHRDWHPLVCHCLDVAAVGERLLHLHARRIEHLARQLGWSTDVLRRTVLFLLAVHDIGKVARTFQAKVPGLWPKAALGELTTQPPADPGHGAVGLWLADCLERQAFEPVLAGWDVEQRQALLAPFFGHHGRPVAVPRNAHPRLVLGAAGREAARPVVRRRGSLSG